MNKEFKERQPRVKTVIFEQDKINEEAEFCSKKLSLKVKHNLTLTKSSPENTVLIMNLSNSFKMYQENYESKSPTRIQNDCDQYPNQFEVKPSSAPNVEFN